MLIVIYGDQGANCHHSRDVIIVGYRAYGFCWVFYVALWTRVVLAYDMVMFHVVMTYGCLAAVKHAMYMLVFTAFVSEFCIESLTALSSDWTTRDGDCCKNSRLCSHSAV